MKTLKSLMMLIAAIVCLIACGGDSAESSSDLGGIEKESFALGPNDYLFKRVLGTWKLTTECDYYYIGG